MPLAQQEDGYEHFAIPESNWHYCDRNPVTGYIVLMERNHFVSGKTTWKEDADCILNPINSLSPVVENTHGNVGVVADHQPLSNPIIN